MQVTHEVKVIHFTKRNLTTYRRFAVFNQFECTGYYATRSEAERAAEKLNKIELILSK